MRPCPGSAPRRPIALPGDARFVATLHTLLVLLTGLTLFGQLMLSSLVQPLRQTVTLLDPIAAASVLCQAGDPDLPHRRQPDHRRSDGHPGICKFADALAIAVMILPDQPTIPIATLLVGASFLLRPPLRGPPRMPAFDAQPRGPPASA